MGIFQRSTGLLIALRKYLKGTATAEERKLLETYYDFLEHRPDMLSDFSREELHELETRMKNHVIAATNKGKDTRTRSLWQEWLPRAAAILLVTIITGGSYYFFTKDLTHQHDLAIQPVTDIEPGGNRALLTLGDGTTVVLDSAANGAIANQDHVSIHKTEEGQIAYQELGPGTELRYNTISTPAGGQYKVKLPDGSSVWLNAASSIRFPTRFSTEERAVFVTGEVFCDVKKDPKRPFRVHIVNKQSIEVLGTSFSLNAYADEAAIKTTLVEGSLRVKSISNNQEITLRPGQRSSLAAGKTIQLDDHVDVYQDIAWKEGLFYFEDAELPTVMRQLSRWYDINVVYEGTPPTTKFSGKIFRTATALQALEILSFTGVHFKIAGPSMDSPRNRIIVTP